MKLCVSFLSLLLGIFHSARELKGKCEWNNTVSSKHYWNTKLVLETGTPLVADKTRHQNLDFILFLYHDFFSILDLLGPKEWSEFWVRMLCVKKCAKIQTCLGFNFYSNRSQYVCEYLPENFCSNRQRIALQAWPGGTVWDKLSPGIKKACIEQKFADTINTRYCDTGRYGCRAIWPNCDTCVKTCQDCNSTYNGTFGLYNCTLWPEGPFQTPIFSFCDSTATFVIKRNVDNYTGRDLSRYLMPLYDMYRLSKLQSYKSIVFNFRATDGTNYSSTYANFAIDSKGSLMNMTYKSGNGQDGFRLSGKALKPSPFVIVRGPWWGNCGSFWFLNATQSSATLFCPGGGVGMFGDVNFLSSDQLTKYGIRWPKASADWKVLIYADIKFDV